MKYMARKFNSECGSALLGALVIATVSFIVLGYVLGSVGTGGDTVQSHKIKDANYYEAERSLNASVSWLRANSSSLLAAFMRSTFYSNFDRVTPSTGTNDSGASAVLSRLRVQGTTGTPLLVSDTILGTPSFPVFNSNGSTFNAQTLFKSAMTGLSLSRITLVDVIPVTASSDFGDTDQQNPAPATDFYPIWRVDSLSDVTSGAHVYAMVVGSLTASDRGFYGQDGVTMGENCDSYNASTGRYGGANRHAACPVSSNGKVEIKTSRHVYGSVKTNGSISASGAYQGKVCGDFVSGCPVPGTTCSGASCGVSLLESAPTWESFCPSERGALVVKTNTTLSIQADDPQFKCWKSVTINKKVKLTLVTSNVPYFFKVLSLKSGASIVISPPTALDSVTLYLNTSPTLTDTNIGNSGNAPSQFVLNYWSAKTLKLTVADSFSANIYSPRGKVQLTGAGDFFGAIQAKALLVTGKGLLHYDESNPVGQSSDLKFKVSNFNQLLQ